MARKMMGSSVKKTKTNEAAEKKKFMAQTAFLRKATLLLAIASVILAVSLLTVILLSGIVFSAQIGFDQILAKIGYSLLLLLIFIIAAVWFFINYNRLRKAQSITAMAYLLFVIVCTFSVFYSILINNFAPINFVYIIVDIIAIVALSKVLQLSNAQRSTAANKN
ncbi:hypothetical protein [Culicoidibacter larvae]|uniref:Uncharacterized protein n=1 Tax=Culicoidibacter larvae TaxID=2579976 RepID=A0A5R8QBD8_9FIRM|nr:hypothetical protein [Culicoidibacter larvae]TLG72969.1 hypothetical protein FEZ08_07955 [Culicoidibacter larvae]